jgi:hypothetical protein
MWFLQCSAYNLCVSDFIVPCSICNWQSSGKGDFFTSLLCASTILFILYLIFYAALFIMLFGHVSICKWLLLHSYCMVPTPSWSVGYWWGYRGSVHPFLEYTHRTTEVCRHRLSSLQPGMVKTFPWTCKFLHIMGVCNFILEMIMLIEVYIHW